MLLSVLVAQPECKLFILGLFHSYVLKAMFSSLTVLLMVESKL